MITKKIYLPVYDDEITDLTTRCSIKEIFDEFLKHVYLGDEDTKLEISTSVDLGFSVSVIIFKRDAWSVYNEIDKHKRLDIKAHFKEVNPRNISLLVEKGFGFSSNGHYIRKYVSTKELISEDGFITDLINIMKSWEASSRIEEFKIWI
tara:strand:- start:43 stop:489 length:447 start_codon:yes stop_codon:yes gene_type:complete